MGNSVIHFVRAQSEQRFFAFYLDYDKRGCEMCNSVIHFVRAQSEQRFNTPPLGAVRASKASSPQYRLARPCGIFIKYIFFVLKLLVYFSISWMCEEGRFEKRPSLCIFSEVNHLSRPPGGIFEKRDAPFSVGPNADITQSESCRSVAPSLGPLD